METSMLSLLLQSMLGLAIVLGIFALLVWGMRRLNLHQGGPNQRDFKIIQRLYIDSKNSIVEVHHKDQHYLLGLSPGGMVQLHGEMNPRGQNLNEQNLSELTHNHLKATPDE
ncbi:MAG: flagellar biosynthetic protein FliO [Mariprofundus sp.]|nr:flagellar biosynthetic protein FliO [Mariprofundus sp.]